MSVFLVPGRRRTTARLADGGRLVEATVVPEMPHGLRARSARPAGG
jgi:hypothetical protein